MSSLITKIVPSFVQSIEVSPRDITTAENTLKPITKPIEPSRKRKLEEISTNSVDTLEKMRKTTEESTTAKKRKITSCETKRFQFVYDQYTQVRGEPKMLELTCKKCNTWFMDYQKDGPGELLRCYVDRIYHPRALRECTFTKDTIHKIDALDCVKCKTVLAVPMMYERQYPSPEVRSAYKIIRDRNVSRINIALRRE